MLGVACLLDRALNVNGICKSMVCCFYIANEGISIIENGGKLGLPIPKKIIDVLLAVKRKAEESEVDKNGSTD
jgi:phage-related holin